MDDTAYTAWLIILTLIVPGTIGFSVGGFSAGLSGIFVSLICLPVILFFICIGLFRRHEDIYG